MYPARGTLPPIMRTETGYLSAVVTAFVRDMLGADLRQDPILNELSRAVTAKGESVEVGSNERPQHWPDMNYSRALFN
jgi:hypothetical protein